MAENEYESITCEECGQEDACYTISVMMGGQVTQRHLCPQCMARMNMSIATGNVKHLLSAIMAAITGTAEQAAQESAQEPAEEPQEDLICERCQTTLSQFTKSGHLGCPACYRVFREQLTPMLQQLHGHAQHVGRKPLDTEEAQRSRSRHEELQRQLEAAVQQEDFEQAAALRDQLRALADEEA